MADQADMFAGPLPPASFRRSPSPALLPQRPIAWERLLGQASATDITIMVLTAWTGMFVEVLSDPELGRKVLRADGAIDDLAADRCYGRTIFLTVEQASNLHKRWPLLKLGKSGTIGARFELAATSDPVESDTMAVLARLGEEESSPF